MSTVACPACHASNEEASVRCGACGAPLPARAGGAVQRGDQLSVGAWSKISRVCGWCDARTRDPRDESCDSCGGPLPPLPPRILEELQLGVPVWPAPPATPRQLPSGYERRVRYWKNVSVTLGFVCTVFFFWTVVFALIGILLFVSGYRKADRWIRALIHGTAVEGTITRVALDRNQSINHQHPWQIDYRFETPGGTVEGHVTSWDPLTGRREAGERVWVVFDPKETTTNALWPPVA